MSDDFLLERMPTARRRPPALAGGAGPRPAYREEAPFKIHGGCGLMGICDESGALMPADIAVRAMAIQRDRGNGLGAGFAGYGIYPEFPDHFCFHLMFHDERAREEVEAILDRSFVVDQAEPIPTRPFGGATDVPLLWRYFLLPDQHALEALAMGPDDFVVHTVMQINSSVDGAFVASSGKNMGAFKGVAFPEEIAHFFRLEEYEAYTWLGHNRFPTNTPGWWGGAHPFTLLDWSIVHNGEISSYGINSRYLEQFGYRCSLGRSRASPFPRRSPTSSASRSTRPTPGSATTASPPTRRAGGAGRIRSRCSTGPSCTTARSPATASTAGIWSSSAIAVPSVPTPRWWRTSSTS